MKKIILFLNIVRFFPHLLVFAISSNKNVIIEDLIAYKNEYKITYNTVISLVHFLFHNKSFRILFYHRVGDVKWIISFLAKGIQNCKLTNISIGSGLLLFHSYGTILNAKSIGKNCRIVHNVTLGDKNGKKPVIGNNVEILANAVIFGDVSVGDNCVIGPGAVIHKSVSQNCVVIGNPAIVLKRNGKIVNEKL